MDDNKVKWTRKVRRYLRDAFSWLDTGLMLNARSSWPSRLWAASE